MPLSSFLTGTPSQIQEFQRFTPNQLQFLNQALSTSGSLLPQLTAPAQTQQRRAELEKYYQTQYVPSLLERFAGTGRMPQYSGSLEAALGSAGQDLTKQLMALEEGAEEQRLGRLQNLFGQLSGLGVQPQFDRAYIPGTPGLFGSLAGGLGIGLGSYTGLGGNPIATLLGLLGGRTQQSPIFKTAQAQGLPSQLGVQGYFSRSL